MNHKKLIINGLEAAQFELVKKYNKIFLNRLIYLKKLSSIKRPYFKEKLKLKRFRFAKNRVFQKEKMIDRFYFESSRYYCNGEYFVNENYPKKLHRWL